jgi:hypothetical protein
MSGWRVFEGTGKFPHRLEEGGTWEKHGFTHGSKPEAGDAHSSCSFFASCITFWAMWDGISS